MKLIFFLLPFLAVCLLTEADHLVGQTHSDTHAVAATNDVSFSPDGSSIATVTTDNAIAIWNTKTGELLSKFQSQETYMSEIDWTPNGKFIVTASRGGSLQLISNKTGDIMWTVGDFSKSSYRIDGGIGQVEISPDGRFVAGLQTFPKSVLSVWMVRTGEEIVKVDLQQQTDVFIWSEDNQKLYLGDDSGTITVRSFPEMNILETFQTNLGRLIDIDLKGELLAAGGEAGKLVVTDTSFADTKYTFDHGAFINRIAISDGKVASVGGNGQLKVWNLKLGDMLFEKLAHNDIAYYVSASPAESILATVGEDNYIRFWEAETGDLHLEIDGY